MKVLVIWDMVPEDTHAYLINDPTEEQLKVLMDANGKIINVHDDTESVSLINDALSNKKEWCLDETPDEWKCIWTDCKVNFPIEGPIDLVVYTGFAL